MPKPPMNETDNVHGTQNKTFHCLLSSFFTERKQIYRPIYSQSWLCPALGSIVNKLWMMMMTMMMIWETITILRHSFSHCVNIEGEPPSPGPRPPFLLHVILRWSLANPSCAPNLKSLAPAVAEILSGNPQILGNSHSPVPPTLFLWV